ncbi:MAG TPA: hypothetical protein VFT95_03200 [Micromonosporaceae bacterium]|nr:hypothetical protein [Micromonosporaceae bacterium]
MFEPETVIYGFALAAGVVVGAVGVLFVQFCQSEAAKQRLIDRRFWPTLERVRQQTGGRIGVVESVPAAMSQPWWADLPRPPAGEVVVPDEERPVEPDDGEAYPPDLRAAFGATRLSDVLRGDEQQAVWPVNREPGAHRRVRPRGDDTQQFNPTEVLDAAGVGGAS